MHPLRAYECVIAQAQLCLLTDSRSHVGPPRQTTTTSNLWPLAVSSHRIFRHLGNHRQLVDTLKYPETKHIQSMPIFLSFLLQYTAVLLILLISMYYKHSIM